MRLNLFQMVAPFVGAWIEIIYYERLMRELIVAPFVGAWIEILSTLYSYTVDASLRSSERGLK